MRVRTPRLAAVLIALTLGAASGVRAGEPAPAAPPARPATEDALVERALGALRANDAAAYLALIHTPAEVAGYCPDMSRKRVERELTRLQPQVRRGVAGCHFRLDWTRARRVAIRGGDGRKAVRGCRQGLQTLRDVVLTYEVDGRRWEVRLADPFVLDGARFGFNAPPRCADVTAP